MKNNPLKKLEMLGKEQLIKMLNQALELEHADRIQYLAHAELVKNFNAEKIIENKDALPYVFETLEHEVRHVILDEQEHAAELSVLPG